LSNFIERGTPGPGRRSWILGAHPFPASLNCSRPIVSVDSSITSIGWFPSIGTSKESGESGYVGHEGVAGESEGIE
jgi:hypothetical protein